MYFLVYLDKNLTVVGWDVQSLIPVLSINFGRFTLHNC